MDITVGLRERKKVYNHIYKHLEKTGVTRGFFRDNAWEGVSKVQSDITEVLSEISNEDYRYEVSIAPDNGGYRTSKDGTSQWKEYKVEIFKVPNTYEDYPEPFIIGTLNCHAAGTVSDPFAAYDMSFIISYN